MARNVETRSTTTRAALGARSAAPRRSIVDDVSVERRVPSFFDLLLDVESNIPSEDPEWSVASDTVVVNYWQVHEPGRVKRSWDTGEPLADRITVTEFMRRTGVADVHARAARTGIRPVQYAVLNPWGFVGYQFGEPLLIDLQYYVPARRSVTFADGSTVRLPSYYSSALPVSTWRHGTTEQVYYDEFARSLRIGTDVNRWSGSFTGKDGVHSLADLRTASAQEAVLRSSLARNARILDRQLAKIGETVWIHSEGRPSAACLLAAAHLCGPYAVVGYLQGRAVHADEAGTTIQAYIDRFSGTALEPADLVDRRGQW